jgi:hypothetical protein
MRSEIVFGRKHEYDYLSYVIGRQLAASKSARPAVLREPVSGQLKVGHANIPFFTQAGGARKLTENKHSQDS